MHFRSIIPSFLLGIGIGAALTFNGMLEVFAAAFGYTREEVCQQLSWYFHGPERTYEW